MEHAELTRKYLRGEGVEIGAFRTPIPGIKPIYVDRFATYADEPTLADYYGDACDLPFHGDSLDYVASSHVIEHVANPIAALREWVRVLRSGGCVYMVVPDRRYTFDRTRALTDPDHVVADFSAGVTQCDGTHIDEFVFGVDWSLYSPATPPADVAAAQAKLAHVYHATVKSGMEINIHFHTFEADSMVRVIETGNRAGFWAGTLKVADVQERFPDSNPIGFLVVARVEKTFRQRARSWLRPKGLRSDARRLGPLAAT